MLLKEIVGYFRDICATHSSQTLSVGSVNLDYSLHYVNLHMARHHLCADPEIRKSVDGF